MTDIPSGYTPGKWIYARDDGKACITTVARCGDYVIGLDSTPYEGGNYRDSALSPDDEADARLIALAPEMADEIVRLRADLAQVREELNLNRLGLSLTRDQRDDLRALNTELLEGLNTIAAWHEGPKVSGHFDEPAAASVARALITAAFEFAMAEITRLRAEVERKDAALRAWDDAVRVDVTMEGPFYMGVSSTLGRQAWELTRAALTAQEAPNADDNS